MRRLPWRLASDELRVTGVEMERASPRGMTGKKASAPLPSAAPPPSPAGEGKNLWAHMLLACHPERAQRAEGFLKTICEKAKTALFAFSPYSGELHAERVKAARVYKPRAPKGAQPRENRTQSVAKHKRTSGCLSNHGVPQAAACRGTREHKTISARPKAAPFGKRPPFAAYLRLLQER